MKSFLSRKEIERMGNDDNCPFSVDQLTAISKRTPKSEVLEKEDSNGQKYKSVKGSYMKQRLNSIFAFSWDFAVVSKEYVSGAAEVVVHGRLTIRSGGQTIIKEQFGKFGVTIVTKQTSRNSSTTYADNIGNAFKSATTDAFKKCASEIGLCWDIYSQDIEEPATEVKEETPTENHPEKKITERLEHFLSKAKTLNELEDVVNGFLNTYQITPEREKIKQKHLERFKKNGSS